jgi:hypothetical protein
LRIWVFFVYLYSKFATPDMKKAVKATTNVKNALKATTDIKKADTNI